jgi:cbb3-type cytochrome oxidase subunit 3
MVIVVAVVHVDAEKKIRRLPIAERSRKIAIVRGMAMCFLLLVMAVTVFMYHVEEKKRCAEDQMRELESDTKARP